MERGRPRTETVGSANERHDRLRDAMRAIRRAWQALINETTPDALIGQVCERLHETVYEHVWIALLDDNGRVCAHAAARDDTAATAPLHDALAQGVVPRCARQALLAGTSVHISRSSEVCGLCPLAVDPAERTSVVHPIRFGDATYGVLTASVPGGGGIDEDEQVLLGELAEDIAMQLHRWDRQQQVDEARTHYKAIFDFSPTPMLLINPETHRIADANPAAVRFYGWSRDRLVGKAMSEINTLTDGEIALEMQRARDKACNRFQFRHRRADGSIRSVDVHSGPIWSHGRQVLFSVIQDVTERVEAHDRLQAALHALQVAQRAGRLGYFNYDIHSGRIDASDVLYEIFGLEVGVPLDAARWLSLIVEEDRADMRRYLEQVVHTTQRFERVYRLRRPSDGCVRWLHGRAQAVPEAGESGRMMGTVQDVTEDMESREALRAAKEAAEAANRMKSEFLANVSHEIRTPLNAILGFSEVLEMELFGHHSHRKYKEYSHDIRESGAHLMSIIDDIIDLSRVEIGSLVLAEEWIDLATFLTDCVSMFMVRADLKAIALHTTVGPEVGALYADRRRLRQIVVNLVSNAIKFTPAGGEVRLGAHLDEGRVCRLTVADTGIGIAAADLPKVMALFGRSGDPYVREQEGSGLGLPLCQRLAELHQARLHIDSTPGRGTAVSVVFPAERTLQVA